MAHQGQQATIIFFGDDGVQYDCNAFDRSFNNPVVEDAHSAASSETQIGYLYRDVLNNRFMNSLTPLEEVIRNNSMGYPIYIYYCNPKVVVNIWLNGMPIIRTLDRFLTLDQVVDHINIYHGDVLTYIHAYTATQGDFTYSGQTTLADMVERYGCITMDIKTDRPLYRPFFES